MMKILFLVLSVQLFLWSTEFSKCKHLLNRTMFGVDKTHLNSCLQSKNYEDFVHTLIYKTSRVHTINDSVYIPKILPSRKIRDLNINERKQYLKKEEKAI